MPATNVARGVARKKAAAPPVVLGADRASAITFTDYATDPSNYRTWVDVLVAWFERLPVVKRASGAVLAIVAVQYLAGALLALVLGEFDLYVRTPAIYFGGIGLGLVLWAIRIASVRAHALYEDLRPVFAVSDAEYCETIRGWFRKMSSAKGSLAFTLPIFAACIFSIAAAFWLSPLYTRFPSLRPIAFGTAWFTEPLGAKAAIDFYYAVWTVPCLGTGAYLLFMNARFLADLRRLDVIPLVEVVRSRLRRVTDLYLRITLAWFVGVALFAILFIGHFDALAIAVIAALSALGLLTFALPQLVFRWYLVKSHEEMCTYALRYFYNASGTTLSERPDRHRSSDGPYAISDSQSLADLVEMTNRPTLWVYEAADIVAIVLGQALVVASVVLQQLITAHK